jgi:hypothetical protein
MSAFVWRILPPAAIIFGIAVTAACISLLGYGLITLVVAFSRVGVRAKEHFQTARALVRRLSCSLRTPGGNAADARQAAVRPRASASTIVRQYSPQNKLML